MADTFTLIPQDDEGERIVERFAHKTGLDAEEDDGRHVFDVEGVEHEIPFVQTLDEIDEDWSEHLEIGEPA
jgi:hypothetical protein